MLVRFGQLGLISTTKKQRDKKLEHKDYAVFFSAVLRLIPIVLFLPQRSKRKTKEKSHVIVNNELFVSLLLLCG